MDKQFVEQTFEAGAKVEAARLMCLQAEASNETAHASLRAAREVSVRLAAKRSLIDRIRAAFWVFRHG
jgi:hypothetical protein